MSLDSSASDNLDIEIQDDFNALIGGEFDFYGVDNNCFKLDDVAYEAVEDEADGYRSMLGCVETRDVDGKIFFRTPIARVVLERSEGYEKNEWGGEAPMDLYKLTDLHDGHCWLRFGTENYDDYYPSFIFDYSAKGPAD